MEGLLSPLRIQVAKTANGKHDYLQIISNDQFSVNIVLIAEKITVEDCREQPKRKYKRGVQT